MEGLALMPKYEAYKKSGEDWIGDIPVGWDLVPIRSIFKFRNEKNSPVKTEEILSLSIANGVTKYSEEGRGGNKRKDDVSAYKIAHPKDIVLNSMNVIVGAVGMSKFYGAISPVYYALYTESEDVLVEYYEKIFLNEGFQRGLLKFGKGILIKLSGTGKLNTIRMKVSTDDLKTLYFPKPPITEQNLIFAFLDKKNAQIDEAIAIKEQQISLLKERKQIIIQQAVTQGLDPNVPLKESGIIGVGLVPEHWDIVFNRRVFRENSRKVKGDELPLSLSQVDGVIPSNDMKERSLSPSHRNNFKLCFPGDLVVNRFKGHLGVFFNSEHEGIVTFHYGVFEPQKGVHTKFFEHLYHTEPYKAIYAGASNGMTVGLQNLSNQNFYMIKTIRPPEKEQVEICKYIEKISNEINIAIGGIELQIEKLKEYKTTLINSAVTGKIKITPEMIEQ